MVNASNTKNTVEQNDNDTFLDSAIIGSIALNINILPNKANINKTNKDNIKNGFFELDWNEYFVLQLKEAGYKGDSEEMIVDSWFGELCRNVGGESGVNMNQRSAGYINVNNLGDGRTEVS
jgi:hypothetical protein